MRARRTETQTPEDPRPPAPGTRDLCQEDWEEFERGIGLFNAGNFRHAGEAWELLRLRHEGPLREFFQGLIHAASAYERMAQRKGLQAAVRSLEKARAALERFQPEHLGMAVKAILHSIDETREDALRSNGGGKPALPPKIRFRKPFSPDIHEALTDLTSCSRFDEAVSLFNRGYYWEAHEAWEDAGRGRDGDARAFAHAFAEMAAGFSFLAASKSDAAAYLFSKAKETLRQFEHNESGVEVGALIVRMEELRELLAVSPRDAKSSIRGPNPPVVSRAVGMQSRPRG